jgi:anti-sigma B factor antagonist
MKISTRNIGEICVFDIEGEIDAEHALTLKKAFAKVLGEKTRKILLGLEKVGFVDSTGLGVMISLLRQLNEQGGALRLAALQDEVRHIFEITRLFKIFAISNTVEDAVREMQKGK